MEEDGREKAVPIMERKKGTEWMKGGGKAGSKFKVDTRASAMH